MPPSSANKKAPGKRASMKAWEKWLSEPVNDEGGSRLHEAAENGTLADLLETFPAGRTLPEEVASAPTKTGKTFLHTAALYGSLDQVAAMAEKTGMPLQSAAEMPDKSGETFLHTAARYGHLDQVAGMAEKAGISLNPAIKARNKSGETFLFPAARNGHLDQVGTMAGKTGLDLQSIAEAHDKFGNNFLRDAARNGHLKQVAAMVEKTGLDLHPAARARDKGGKTFLHFAAQSKNLHHAAEMVEKSGMDLSGALLDQSLREDALKNGQLVPLRNMFHKKADFSWKSMKSCSDDALYSRKGRHFPDLCTTEVFRSPKDLSEYMDRMPEETRTRFKATPPLMKRYAAEAARLKRLENRPARSPIPHNRAGGNSR